MSVWMVVMEAGTAVLSLITAVIGLLESRSEPPEIDSADGAELHPKVTSTTEKSDMHHRQIRRTHTRRPRKSTPPRRRG
jgi:hypothetical protein